MSGKKYFLVLKKGEFVEQEKEGESTVNSFKSITAELVNITFKESKHGKLMKLHLVDEDNFYMVSLFVNGRAAYATLMLLGGIDLRFPFTIKTELNDEGKDVIKMSQFSIPALWQIDHPGFGILLIHDKIKILLDRAEKDLIPQLQKKKNPFPNHLHYKPSFKGVQGGYFDNYKSGGRVIGPVSSEEKNDPYFGMR